jgi:hypothetical protein
MRIEDETVLLTEDLKAVITILERETCLQRKIVLLLAPSGLHGGRI